MATTAAQSGVTEDFSFGNSNTNFPPSNLVNMTITGGRLVANSNVAPTVTSGNATFSGTVNSGDFAVCVEVIGPLYGLEDIGFQLSDGSSVPPRCNLWGGSAGGQGKSIRVSGYGVNVSVPVYTQYPSAVLLAIIKGQVLTFYVNGKLVITQAFPGAIGGPVILHTNSPRGQFANFMYIPTCAAARQTFDGLMQQKQMSVAMGTSVALMEKLYGGELNLPGATTRATSTTTGDLSYRPNFANFNQDQMAVSGDVNSMWSSTTFADSPFVESSLSETSPLLRPHSQGSGGIFRAGRANADTFSYFSSDSDDLEFLQGLVF